MKLLSGAGYREHPVNAPAGTRTQGAEACPPSCREYRKLATQCAVDGADHPDYLLRLAELELIDRHQRMVQRRIRAARFPATKSLDTMDCLAIPSLNIDHCSCNWPGVNTSSAERTSSPYGNSGTGKTHIALVLGLADCQRGMSVAFHHRSGPGPGTHGQAREDRRLAQPAATTGSHSFCSSSKAPSRECRRRQALNLPWPTFVRGWSSGSAWPGGLRFGRCGYSEHRMLLVAGLPLHCTAPRQLRAGV